MFYTHHIIPSTILYLVLSECIKYPEAIFESGNIFLNLSVSWSVQQNDRLLSIICKAWIISAFSNWWWCRLNVSCNVDWENFKLPVWLEARVACFLELSTTSWCFHDCSCCFTFSLPFCLFQFLVCILCKKLWTYHFSH